MKKMGQDIGFLKTQVNTVNIVLKKHDNDLLEHENLITGHSRKLESLEQMVGAHQVNPSVPITMPSVRSVERLHSSTRSVPAIGESTQKFDINYFSEQQRKILSVFFQNQDMALAYMDIAKILNKSPHTIKNHMREIRLKADLFERSIGEQSRHRFKLKTDLRIEKYLNVGQAINQS